MPVAVSNLQRRRVSPRRLAAVVGGGLGGAIGGGGRYVRILWLARGLRVQGHGQRLLEAAERRAIERGCRHVFLDTFTFQAPGFYLKHGYEVYARAEDWPVGHAHLFLRKALGGAR